MSTTTLSEASPTPLEATPQPPRSIIPTLILITCTLLVFGRLCAADFTWWDDTETVHHNALLNPPAWANLKTFWTQPGYGLYIPVTYTAWAAIASISQIAPDPDGIALNPQLFHAANVALHLLSVLVVYRILLVLNADNFAATCGALLFALHPIQVEAVGWISGMKDVLSGMFSLIAIWQYVVFARSDLEQERPAVARYRLATAACVLAMLSKPSAVTLPLIAVAIDRWGIGRPWRRVLPPALGWLWLAVPVTWLASIFQEPPNTPDLPIWQRVFIVGDSLTFYLCKICWPLKLCVDYVHTPAIVLQRGWCYWNWMIPVAIAAWLVGGKRARPVLLAAGIIFVAACMPTLGFKKFLFQYYSTTADHYLYLSFLGPAIALAWVLSIYPKSALRVLTAVVIVLLGLLSYQQCGYWHDDITLFGHNAEVQPNSYLAFNNLGATYGREHNPNAAVIAFRHATEAREDNVLAHSNLAEMEMELGHPDVALSETRIAIKLASAIPSDLRQSWAVDYARLGQLLLKSGEPKEALAALEESLLSDPNDSNAAGLLIQARAAATQPTTRTDSH